MTRSMQLTPLGWMILALLFLSTVIHYIDRQVLSVLVPTLRPELGLFLLVGRAEKLRE